MFEKTRTSCQAELVVVILCTTFVASSPSQTVPAMRAPPMSYRNNAPAGRAMPRTVSTSIRRLPSAHAPFRGIEIAALHFPDRTENGPVPERLAV